MNDPIINVEGFFSDLILIGFYNIASLKYSITKCCSCANSENPCAVSMHWERRYQADVEGEVLLPPT